MNDLNLIYSGGSGGFLLLHLLLLSGKFHVRFNNNKPMDQVIDQQWQISDHTVWKQNEVWPANSKTFKDSTTLRKIYFYCNPSDSTAMLSNCSAIIYTDYHSQQHLSYFKRSHWHINTKFELLNPALCVHLGILREWKKHYNNIKDPAWPCCSSFRHINKLPLDIQQELLNDPYTKSFLDRQFDFVTYRSDTVHRPIAQYLDSADIVVKLQDVVNSNGEILVDAFNIPPINAQQQQLIAHWRSLHPPALLDRIGIAN